MDPPQNLASQHTLPPRARPISPRTDPNNMKIRYDTHVAAKPSSRLQGPGNQWPTPGLGTDPSTRAATAAPTALPRRPAVHLPAVAPEAGGPRSSADQPAAAASCVAPSISTLERAPATASMVLASTRAGDDVRRSTRSSAAADALPLPPGHKDAIDRSFSLTEKKTPAGGRWGLLREKWCVRVR